MIREISRSPLWIDVTNPDNEELSGLAQKYQLPPTAVRDCLDPEHLPKYERIGDIIFLIVRAYDEASDPSADSIQQMTHKVACFMGKDFLITVHRTEQRFLALYQEEVLARGVPQPSVVDSILIAVLNRAVDSYDKPLTAMEVSIERFEASLLEDRAEAEVFKEIYVIKRRVMILKRMLWHSQGVCQRLGGFTDRQATYYQDLKENAESYFVYADELSEDLNNLLNIQMTLAGHRTNEVVRVLTLFSVFFMPLTFIVGIYGMNFKFMPELEHQHGYIAVWAVMLGVTAGIWMWFRRRGWLK